jgi:hypothetical protein
VKGLERNMDGDKSMKERNRYGRKRKRNYDNKRNQSL